MSKGGGTSTTTQTSAPPQYVQDAQKNLLNTVSNFTSPFTSQSPQYTVAGFTPDQMQAFDLARAQAQNTFTAPPINATARDVLPAYSTNGQLQFNTIPAANLTTANLQAWPPYIDAARVDPNKMGGIGYADPALVTRANQYDVNQGQTTGEQIHNLLNPYIGDVIDPTVARMRQQLGQTQAQIGAQGASSAAFGGSREALQQSEAQRNFGDQVAQTVGLLMSQGYDKASATALANAQARQQGGEFNTSAQNAVNEADAARRQQTALQNQQQGNFYWNADVQRWQDASLQNAQMYNNMAQFNVNNQNQASQFNANALNAAGQFNATAQNNLDRYNTDARNQALMGTLNQANADANRQMTGYGVQDTLLNDEATRERAALAQLLGTGQTQQQTAQASLNQPMDMLKLLMSATPNTYGQNSSTTQPTQSNIGSTLGGIASIASLFFSDPKDKTDITKLGTDPGSGLGMYAYRYKGDPKDTPKAVGPMADEVQRKYPEAVTSIGGHKVIRGNVLAAMLGAK